MITLVAPPDSFAFGWAVALGFDEKLKRYIALISARRTGASYSIDDGTDSATGSAYMFSYTSGHWSLQQPFFQSGSVNFGNSLALQTDGSQFAVGGPRYIYHGTWLHSYNI